MTGVFIRKGNQDTDTHKEDCEDTGRGQLSKAKKTSEGPTLKIMADQTKNLEMWMPEERLKGVWGIYNKDCYY